MNLFELFASLTLDSSGYEEGLGDAEKTTNNFGSKLKNGLSKASKVAVGAVTAVSAAGVGLAKTMVSGASDVAKYGDEVDKASQKLGFSATAYQEWDAVLQHSGSSISSITPAIRTLTSNVESGSEAFAGLGLSMSDLQGLSNEELFSTVITALQGVADESERSALASDLLGRSYMELGPLLNTSAEETSAMRERVHELGGVLSEEAVSNSAAFQDSLQDMQTALSGVKNGIVADLLPGFTSLMEGFTSLVAGEEGAEVALQEGLDRIIESMSEGTSMFIDIVGTLLPAFLGAITENLPALAESGTQMLQTVILAILDNLPELVKSGVEVLKTLATTITENLPTIMEAVISAVSEIAILLTDPDTLSMLLTSLMQIILTITKSIVDNIPALIDTMMKVLTNVIEFITENLPSFVQSAVEIINALIEGLVKALPTLVAQLPTIINSIITGLLNMLPQLVQAGVTLLTSLVQNLPQIIASIVRQLPQIISAIVSGIVGAVPQLITAGGQLIQGLWQGISNVGEWLREKISGFFGGVVQSIKNFFGIKSPSKVFAGIGEMLDKGLAKGIGDYADLAVDEAANMAEDVFGATDRDFDFTATANAPKGKTPSQGGGLVINVYGAEGQDVNELAEIISQKIAFGYAQEQAVWA